MRRALTFQALVKPSVNALPSLILAGAALLAGLSPDAQAGLVLDRIKQSGRIVIAHRESSVPFSFLDDARQPVGYSIDLCLRLAEAVRKKLGLAALKPEFLMVTPANRIAVIAEGKADIECGSTTNNTERRQKVAFTVPHYITGARYMVRADSTIGELADFDHRKLVSSKGTTPLKAIEQANRERLMGITILEAMEVPHRSGAELKKLRACPWFP